MPIATRNPAMTRRPDATQTIQMSPREGMIGALSAGLVAAVAARDLEAARIANEAIGKLLGTPAAPAVTTATGAVVDLASARRGGAVAWERPGGSPRPRACDAPPVPRVTFVSDFERAFHPHADPRNVAMIRRRHALWAELARLREWDVAVCDVAALDAAPDGVRGSVCWIDLPMLPRASYEDVFTRVSGAGAACVLDPPEEVDRVLGLDRSYPVLVRAGVPTPRTAFLPVDDALAAAIDSPAAVRNLLIEAIYGALFDAKIDPHDGAFVRGFYSSAKSANPEHYFGSNQADIEATAFGPPPAQRAPVRHTAVHLL